MADEHVGSRLAALLKTLKPKTKQPVSTKILNTWITQAEGQLGDEARGGRLGWLIASSVAIAAVQRAVDVDGRQLFLLKGGTLLQHRLNVTARTTKDVDGLIRGDIDDSSGCSKTCSTSRGDHCGCGAARSRSSTCRPRSSSRVGSTSSSTCAA